ncbi:MAG: signal recognition particle-docking protein FtsY [Candidatus Sedimenticola sp. (ex Thyasira tokunagai)]
MFGFGKRKKQKIAAEAAAKLDVPSVETEETGEPTELEAPATDALDVTTPTEPGTPSAESGELVEIPAEKDGEKKKGLFGRLKERLSRTRSNLTDGLANLVLGHKKIDDDLLEELETLLLMADVGVDTTSRIIDNLSQQVKRNELSDPETLTRVLKEQLLETLSGCDTPVAQPTEGRPQVILMVGINGAGKTTTIGKLAKRLQEEGQSVMLAAGDTFRAAAVEQLQAWGERNDIPVIAQHTGADSASVIFDALEAATARGVDVLIADTAGRLHTKSNLMDELTKVARVMRKIDPEAPHEVMLVVDATTGQNALNQAVQFNQAVTLTGITLTKLDGTAKGGIVFAIADKLKMPIRFIGVGEAIEDLRHFDDKEFVDALFEQ